MNRLYVIQYGTQVIKGLVSPRELPELVRIFYGASAKRGAKADYLGGGVFLAVKNDVKLTLTIGACHKSIPSRILVDVLEETMEKTFINEQLNDDNYDKNKI